MLTLQNITFFISNQRLFQQLNLQANTGDRIGLVGPNGSGKTTLLRLITGKIAPEEGQVSYPADTRIGYLEQEVLEVNQEQRVRDVALQAFGEANRLEERIEELGRSIAERDDYDSVDYQKLLNELERAQARYDLLEGNRKEARAAEMLEGLGFDSEDLDRPVSVFSGGWRMRAVLARLLLEQPDILLLDEPTNHLDIDSIEWLEKYLNRFQGTVILVSHDRYFLNRMTNQIAELHHGRIYTYTGNFDEYLQQREAMIEQQRRDYEAQQREIAQMERFIERFRAKANKASLVQSRIKALERMERIEPPDDSVQEIRFRFQEPPRAGKKVLEIANLKKTYPGQAGGHPVPVFTEGQDLEINRGEKIALVGGNGTGKSTLARILHGDEPFDGQRREGHNVIKSFFAQHLADVLQSGRTVLQEMESAATDSEARSKVRTLLGCFLFTGDDVYKPISVLSGGERSRLALAKTLLQPANFLILDEPTNHLDMTSRKVLVQALQEYSGTVLAVSHDRYFISEIADTVWRAGEGWVTIYPGGYRYYEWKRQNERSIDRHGSDSGTSRSRVSKQRTGQRTGQQPGQPDGQVEGPKSKEQKRKEAELRNRLNRETRELHRRVRQYERELAQLEEEKQELESRLADPEFYQSSEAGPTIQRHAEVEKRVEELMQLWTEASEKIEEKEKQLQRDHA